MPTLTNTRARFFFFFFFTRGSAAAYNTAVDKSRFKREALADIIITHTHRWTTTPRVSLAA